MFSIDDLLERVFGLNDGHHLLHLSSEQDTKRVGACLARLMPRGVLYLQGDLGVGKTFFSQSLIRAAGFKGRVTSPTYTLLEPYELAHRNIFHFDLYRLQEEDELIFLGCDDYFDLARPIKGVSRNRENKYPDSLCLIEWPEKAASIIPSADVELRLEYLAATDASSNARRLTLSAQSEWGVSVCTSLLSELKF